MLARRWGSASLRSAWAIPTAARPSRSPRATIGVDTSSTTARRCGAACGAACWPRSRQPTGGTYWRWRMPARPAHRVHEEIAPQPPRELSRTSKELGDRSIRYFIVLAIALLRLEPIARSARGKPREPTGEIRPTRPRLLAGLFALLPILGADQAESRCAKAMRSTGRANTRRRCDRYETAAEELPESATIGFNRGAALFKNRDQDQALDRYLAALATAEPTLAGRAKYNIGVIKYRQALAALQRYEDALALTQAAIAQLPREPGGRCSARGPLQSGAGIPLPASAGAGGAGRAANARSARHEDLLSTRAGVRGHDPEQAAASATGAPRSQPARSTTSAPTKSPEPSPTTRRRAGRRDGPAAAWR